jgi:hypothetical protein
VFQLLIHFVVLLDQVLDFETVIQDFIAVILDILDDAFVLVLERKLSQLCAVVQIRGFLHLKLVLEVSFDLKLFGQNVLLILQFPPQLILQFGVVVEDDFFLLIQLLLNDAQLLLKSFGLGLNEIEFLKK